MDARWPRGKLPTLAFAALDLAAAIVVALGVFSGLPSRVWFVDAGAAILVALHAASGAGLALRARWAARVARASAIVSLVLGLALVAVLAVTASYLGGIYGPVGRGGSLILLLVAALALPYLVIFPAAQLVWLASGADPERGGPAAREPSVAPESGAPGAVS